MNFSNSTSGDRYRQENESFLIHYRRNHSTSLWHETNNTCCHTIQDIQVHSSVWLYLQLPLQSPVVINTCNI